MTLYIWQQLSSPTYVSTDVSCLCVGVSFSLLFSSFFLFLCQARPPAGSWKKLEETREYKNGNTLREYQLEGVNWLLFNWYNR